MIDHESKLIPDSLDDPLSRVVAMLRPAMSISKLVEAGGQWRVERRDMASPFYCAIVEGTCRIEVTGLPAAIILTAGDFILIPDVHGFTMTSIVAPKPERLGRPLEVEPGRMRLGRDSDPVDMRALVGHCRFEAPSRDLLVSLLPALIHVCRHDRLMALVPVIHEETRANRPGRELILERLLEVLLIEALRSGPATDMPPGLLRGLADPRLSLALRRIHASAEGEISVAELAREAGMSRSGFFEKFRKEIGQAPMDYVTGWRMALAKTLLRQGGLTNAEIAHRIGYGSASAFGMAFQRTEKMSPGKFAALGGET